MNKKRQPIRGDNGIKMDRLYENRLNSKKHIVEYNTICYNQDNQMIQTDGVLGQRNGSIPIQGRGFRCRFDLYDLHDKNGRRYSDGKKGQN